MNTGRWTRLEHDLFVQALDTCGKNWRDIALFVATRTRLQCRSHAQKYFLRLKKQEKQKQGCQRTVYPRQPGRPKGLSTHTDVVRAIDALLKLRNM